MNNQRPNEHLTSSPPFRGFTPSSEVGSGSVNPQGASEDNEEKWRLLLEQQNRNFLALLQVMKTPSVNNNNNVRLPEFDPDKLEVNARSWITTADICMADQPLQGASLMIVLSRAMRGQASAWLSQVSYAGITWIEFKELFVSRYDCPETSAAFLINLFSSKPKEGECIASYAASLMNSLMNQWKNLTTEEIALSTTMAHIARFESRVQRLAFTTDIVTRNQLHNELKAMSFLKRRSSDSLNERNEGSEFKRYKFTPSSPAIKCFLCGKMGHRASTCRSRKENHEKERQIGIQKELWKKNSPVRSSDSIKCFKCQKMGHYASRCLEKAAKEGLKNGNGKIIERRVDMCEINTPAGVLQQAGERFSFYYDSGSQCSLIKESISCKIRGKRLNNVVTMTGIGQTSVNSTLQILSTVNIDDITIEILFHVLLDRYLRHDVMIGAEILSQGLSVLMTVDTLKLTKTHVVNMCNVTVHEFDLDSVDTDIPLEFKSKLVSILNKFKNQFVYGTPKGRADVEPVKIRLKDPNKTVYRRPYRLSEEERKIVRDKINELLNAKVIRPSSSPFASPILLVKKKDGSDRMCIDYRELNDNTVPERFPLPLISDQINRLHRCYYFTILDMASGYHQLPIHPDSIEKTAFITTEGHFEYLALPFGLRNAPAAFQRAVITALGELANTYVVVYMDDILVVGTQDVEESLNRVENVLNTLTKAGFSLNIKKCSFMKQKVEYLGYEVSRGEVRPNPRKIEALVALPPPQTVSQLRQFIGLASYFRQFLPKFSQILAPLFALTSSTKKNLNWKPDHEAIRQKIITFLTNEPVLTIYNPENPTELHTDASSIGYGAILMQKKEDKLRAVAYFSKRTTTAESKYHSYELETLAVVNSVKHFRHYLHGCKFTVITDCSSLQASRKKLDLTPRVHRWWAFLQAFDFDIVHRDGKRMSHADFFSRNPLPEAHPKTFSKVEQKEVYTIDLSGNWLSAEQQRDSEISKLITDLNENRLDEEVCKTLEIRSGILYRKIQRNGRSRWLPILPRALRWSVINTAHESLMHLGWEKTLEKLYDLYWFEKMSKFTRKFVDNCVTCKITKSHSGKIQAELHPIPKIAIPWHTIHIDATGKLSGKNDKKEYVFVMIDAFTKFVILRHALRIDTVSSIKALSYCVSLFGAPIRVIADQGRCFASTDFREFCESHKINLHLIATGSSRANGQVERVMSTLRNMLTAAETSKERSWQDALSDVQLALNCTVNRVTKSSPLELLMGKVARPLKLMLADDIEPRIDLDEVRSLAVANMDKNAEYDKTRFDRTKAKVDKFVIGDFVLLQNEERNQTKLDPKYKGPFKVVDVLDGDRYVLTALDSNRRYKYSHDRLRKMPDTSIQVDIQD